MLKSFGVKNLRNVLNEKLPRSANPGNPKSGDALKSEAKQNQGAFNHEYIYESMAKISATYSEELEEWSEGLDSEGLNFDQVEQKEIQKTKGLNQLKKFSNEVSELKKLIQQKCSFEMLEHGFGWDDISVLGQLYGTSSLKYESCLSLKEMLEYSDYFNEFEMHDFSDDHSEKSKELWALYCLYFELSLIDVNALQSMAIEFLNCESKHHLSIKELAQFQNYLITKDIFISEESLRFIFINGLPTS